MDTAIKTDWYSKQARAELALAKAKERAERALFAVAQAEGALAQVKQARAAAEGK